MNSDFDNRASSNDPGHETEAVDDFYTEGEEHEDEAEAEFIDRALENKESNAAELPGSSKSSLFEFIYVGKEQEEEGEEEEEEEEEAVRAFEDDGSSAGVCDEKGVCYRPLSEEERQEIIQKVKDLFSEAKVHMIVNKFLHKHYIDINRKSPSMANALDKFDESLIFEDTQYQAVLENFARTRQEFDGRTTALTTELENLDSSCSAAESDYAKMFESLLSQQLALAKQTRPSKYAKDMWLAQVEQLLDSQRQRASEVAKIRLAHVLLQGKLAKLTAKLKTFDSLGRGFSMMDYEYLQKRNDVYSERRDEQGEHINKLKENNLASAAIIRHIDEEADLYNERVANNLEDLDALVSENKYERSKSVQLAKSKVTISKVTARLREQIGLLNYPFLLRKMERDLREIAKLKKRSKSLQAKMVADAQEIAKHCSQSRVFANK